MRLILLIFFVACASFVYGQNKSYDYCYQNNKGICVYSVADKAEQVILKKGSDACISPDGKKVAYTTYSPKGDRTIAVIDLNTKKKTELNTGSNNCYGPMWSPDGKLIAYNVFNTQTSKWFIAVINADNTAPPKVLTGKLEESYMPVWLAGSKTLSVQDMNSVYVFNLTGEIMKTYKMEDISKEFSSTSSDRYIFAGNKIVFNSEVNEVSDSDEPPTAIFVYDIASKKCTRITPKEYFPYAIAVKKNKIIFSAAKGKSKTSNVYTVNTDGSNFQLLFKNASYLSARN
jgi:Tol biopolymer transport system component